MEHTSTVTYKGQITLPARLRDKLKVKAGQKVGIYLQDDTFIVKPLPQLAELKGSLKKSKPTTLDNEENTFGEVVSENYHKKS